MTQIQGWFFCLSTLAEPTNAFDLQSLMNERDGSPNPDASEEPTVEGLMFSFGFITEHLAVIVIWH